MSTLFFDNCEYFRTNPSPKVIKKEFIFEEGAYFKQCHASTMEQSSDGHLLASWFGGSHEGAKDVVIWGARSMEKHGALLKSGQMEKLTILCVIPVGILSYSDRKKIRLSISIIK